MTKPIHVVLKMWVTKVRRISNRAPLNRQVGVLPKLYKADLVYVIWGI
jgi:hypothetical protein